MWGTSSLGHKCVPHCELFLFLSDFCHLYPATGEQYHQDLHRAWSAGIGSDSSDVESARTKNHIKGPNGLWKYKQKDGHLYFWLIFCQFNKFVVNFLPFCAKCFKYLLIFYMVID